MIIEISVELEHGIMFLHDPDSEVVIPVDPAESPVTQTSSCISFHVPTYVDGAAHVILSDGAPMIDEREVYSGILSTPSHRISMSDVPVNYYAILHLKDEYASVKIWKYVEHNIDKTWVMVANIDTF